MHRQGAALRVRCQDLRCNDVIARHRPSVATINALPRHAYDGHTFAAVIPGMETRAAISLFSSVLAVWRR